MKKFLLVLVCVLGATFECETAVLNPKENAVVPEIGQNNTRIVPGAGLYKGQVAPRVCFNVTMSSHGNSASLRVGAMSVTDLERKIGGKFLTGGGADMFRGEHEMFPGEAKASYLKSIQDTDHSISLIYYFALVTSRATMQTAGFSVGALNEFGKNCYDDGKNPQFKSLCGDYYISSYQQGALLTMAMNVNFSSADAKSKFTKEAGAELFSIEHAATAIKDAVQKLKVSGSVTTQALQIGGEPSHLAKILNKENSGYYALTCNFTAIDDCIKAASSLGNYAKDDFSKQISSDTGFVPLGINFIAREPIRYIGLKPAAS